MIILLFGKIFKIAELVYYSGLSGSTQYRLFAVCCHAGDCATMGHYWAECRHSETAEWNKYNDTRSGKYYGFLWIVIYTYFYINVVIYLSNSQVLVNTWMVKILDMKTGGTKFAGQYIVIIKKKLSVAPSSLWNTIIRIF